MNLFGGSENYILQTFETSTNMSEANDSSHISITLNKLHTVKDGLRVCEVSEEGGQVTPSEFKSFMVVLDDYVVVGDTVELYLNGVGRFVIVPTPFKKNMFALFKKIVTSERYFTLVLTVLANTWLVNVQKIAKTESFEVVFSASEVTASFSVK